MKNIKFNNTLEFRVEIQAKSALRLLYKGFSHELQA